VTRVGTAARVRDLLAILCLVGGGALYATSAAGMRAMAAGETRLPLGQSHLAETDRLMTRSRAGLALAAVGVGIALWSFYRHRSSSKPPR
jgi:formate hydrogenlyase subunit 3/multisubunit Na+/H+ antiporter MnhD subunit